MSVGVDVGGGVRETERDKDRDKQTDRGKDRFLGRLENGHHADGSEEEQDSSPYSLTAYYMQSPVLSTLCANSSNFHFNPIEMLLLFLHFTAEER